MIKILGIKRIAILVGLLALNGLFAFMAYGYLIPANTKSERELRSVKGQVSSVQRDLDNINVEFALLEKQQEQFELFKDDGFFKQQDRFEAGNIFKTVQEQSGVLTAKAQISSGTIVDDENAEKAEHKLLVSDIDIDIESLTDLSVFNYLYLLENAFPGHLSIESFELVRNNELTGAVLRSIANGESPALVSAKLNLSWTTMIPQSVVEEREGR